MRIGVIQRILSRLLWFTVVALAVPLVVSLGYRDGTWLAWIIPGVCAAMLAWSIARLPSARAAPEHSLRRREGFLAVVLGWMVLVFFTAVAFHVAGAFHGFAAAFFESMSGFTTTGATVARDIEALPHSILFMRSFSHWIGGMGIIVLSVAILPELAVGGMQLMTAEASGISGADKLAPRIVGTARRLWTLYVAITVALAILLLFGGMSVFDAVNHSMATIATGGFSTKNASIGAYDSLYIEIVIIVFMWISGVNFALQFRAILGGAPLDLVRSPEVRLYAALTLAGIVLITFDLWQNAGEDLFASTRHASFTTVAIITTTGFGITAFGDWPAFSHLILVALMIVGACAGSTAGGSKVVRLYVVFKHAVIQLRRLVRPRLVETLTIGDKVVSRETTEAVLGYYLLYISTLLALSLGMTALGMDIVSGGTAAVSALNSIGPGLGTVHASFLEVPDAGLYLASFGMLLGRLELYTLLVLFIPHFWRRG